MKDNPELLTRMKALVGQRVHVIYGEGSGYAEIISELHLDHEPTQRFRVWGESLYPNINIKSLELGGDLPVIRV